MLAMMHPPNPTNNRIFRLQIWIIGAEINKAIMLTAPTISDP
jgi:hypothetical protein